MLKFLKQHPQCITLDVRVKPGRRQNAISVDATGMLVLSLQAVAEDGRANKMLIKYLAKLLRIKQMQISIERGVVSRNKVISIASTPDAQNRIIECMLKIGQNYEAI